MNLPIISVFLESLTHRIPFRQESVQLKASSTTWRIISRASCQLWSLSLHSSLHSARLELQSIYWSSNLCLRIQSTCTFANVFRVVGCWLHVLCDAGVMSTWDSRSIVARSRISETRQRAIHWLRVCDVFLDANQHPSHIVFVFIREKPWYPCKPAHD